MSPEGLVREVWDGARRHLVQALNLFGLSPEEPRELLNLSDAYLVSAYWSSIPGLCLDTSGCSLSDESLLSVRLWFREPSVIRSLITPIS